MWGLIKMYKWQIIAAILTAILTFAVAVKRVDGGARVTLYTRITSLEARVDSLEQGLLDATKLLKDSYENDVKLADMIGSLTETDKDILLITKELIDRR